MWSKKISKSLVQLTATLAVVGWAGLVSAQSLQLGAPAYGGSGCPAGSASLTVSPDSSEVSVLFDEYVAEAGRQVNKTIDRKSCNLAVPVIVPQGFSVAIFKVDYRGFNAIPSGARTRLDAEYFWAGLTGPRVSRTFLGPANDNFTVTDELQASALVWSACGASTNLRINSSMMAQTNSRRDQVIGSVDSVDISNRIIYHLRWKRCN